MSYCRFSSENFKSDFYIYESCYGGIQIHLAANRVVGDIPKLLKWDCGDEKAFFNAYQAQTKFLETAEREKINLPYAGDSFGFNTIEDAILKVKELVSLGFYLPEGVLEAMEEDIGLIQEDVEIDDCL